MRSGGEEKGRRWRRTELVGRSKRDFGFYCFLFVFRRGENEVCRQKNKKLVSGKWEGKSPKESMKRMELRAQA